MGSRCPGDSELAGGCCVADFCWLFSLGLEQKTSIYNGSCPNSRLHAVEPALAIMARSRSPSPKRRRAKADQASYERLGQASLEDKRSNPVLCNDILRPLRCQVCMRGLCYPSPAISECWVSAEDVGAHPSDRVAATLLSKNSIGKDVNEKRYFVVCQWHELWLKRLWQDGTSPFSSRSITVRSPGSSSGSSGSAGSKAAC